MSWFITLKFPPKRNFLFSNPTNRVSTITQISSNKLIYSCYFFWTDTIVSQLPLWGVEGKEDSRLPCKADLVWTKRQPQKTRMFASCPGLRESPPLAPAKCARPGSGPGLCAYLAAVKNHSRVPGITIPFPKSCREAVQRNDICKEPSAQPVVSTPQMPFMIFRRDCIQFRWKAYFFFNLENHCA